jgi:hypothetical protein
MTFFLAGSSLLEGCFVTQDMLGETLDDGNRTLVCLIRTSYMKTADGCEKKLARLRESATRDSHTQRALSKAVVIQVSVRRDFRI